MDADSTKSPAIQGDILDILGNRRSQPRLTSPGPSRDDIDTIINSALHVPDHHRLSPWRVVAVEDNQRDKLAVLWSEYATTVSNDVTKLKTKAARAPLILICIASPIEHPKVPRSEQLVTAGIAAYSMLLAANGLGYQGYWRTGKLAYDPKVLSALGLTDEESIVGYLYLGSGAENERPQPEGPTSQDKLSYLE
ncbi:MAG: nitroreductase [Pseudomonadales bacterium]|nr:nitroreductase [Pseudomonadales bacterium]